MKGKHFDLSSDVGPAGGEKPAVGKRQFVGIQFTCCQVYTRIYVNRQGTAYEGNCPKCSKRVTIKVGPGGTDSRFFTVS